MRPAARLNGNRQQVVSTLPAGQPKYRVLVVDDDAATATLLLAAAERCEVVVATDGLKAYRLLRTDNNFDAMVINPAIPGLDGMELLRYTKSENRLKRIPIVALAGENAFRSLVTGFAGGAVACLWKPTTGEMLWKTLRMLFPQHAAKRKAA